MIELRAVRMSWSKLGEFVAREEGFGQRPLGDASRVTQLVNTRARIQWQSIHTPLVTIPYCFSVNIAR